MDCLAEGTLMINHSTEGIDKEKEHRSLCEELKEAKENEFHDEWIIRGVLHEMRMGLLAGPMDPFEKYTMIYPTLAEEFKKIDEKDSRDEILLHALDILNLEKIYAYEWTLLIEQKTLKLIWTLHCYVVFVVIVKYFFCKTWIYHDFFLL